MDNHQYDDFDNEQRFKFLTGKNLLRCVAIAAAFCVLIWLWNWA